MQRATGRSRRSRPAVEGLEDRRLLSDASTTLFLETATTTDSKSVTVTYVVDGGELDQPVPLGIYRSADNALDAADLRVGTGAITAAAAGRHTETIELTEPLAPLPQKPFVLVVADPDQTTGVVASEHGTAGFRKHVVGVITHGGMQSKGVGRAGPWWQRRMAAELESQGYDTVIPFNWVNFSREPGAMPRQAPRLAAQLTEAVAAFPEGEPVDVHMIGHSEGAVLNSLALEYLVKHDSEPDAMKAGFVKVTMLDPHSASTGIQGQQYSVSNGIFGTVAKALIDEYQSRADDPPPFVPENTDAAEVFFQRTHTADAQAGHQGWYNLWGQVPVVGDADYFDLTGKGLSHSGKFAVYDWYILHVVPELGAGAAFLKESALKGALTTPPSEGRTARGYLHVAEHRLTYEGEAMPGSVVQVLVARPNSSELGLAGRVVADEDGHWEVTTRRLYSGLLRAVAIARLPRERGTRPIHMRPVTWMGQVVIDRTTPREFRERLKENAPIDLGDPTDD